MMQKGWKETFENFSVGSFVIITVEFLLLWWVNTRHIFSHCLLLKVLNIWG